MEGQPRPTDAELLTAAVEDPRAFLGIFERHFDAVHRFISPQLDASAAEDATAEVFVRALRGAHSYAPEVSDARPWLFGIATNVIRAELRDRYAGRSVSLELVAPRATHASDEERLDEVGRLADVQKAVALLSHDEREPLLLFAWLDLTYEEIAIALDLPIGTVRSRIARARKRLGNALGLQQLEVITDGTYD